ncbi:type IV pilus assembly PilZ [Geobacter metallireducens RCH3]|uniref:PilZ domain protein n=1 Tax=Geobacter metallireducens (strain ATCC 53774 / DSM 7210 / GS-15) TaxID=269799 RepID=Q39Z87_GEOMG|nr:MULTISPECIES: PilZ domain-containing protein [Geobacter]ABB30437.1 PilZ domain protein [Geobacter metallireducens GS-15]EHP87314.1 type IV pilus assembly PilZ [Geobacter metallireducens RCH3]MBT1073675.1 PilZ domain-containing protein [Geobacter grbiciae]
MDDYYQLVPDADAREDNRQILETLAAIRKGTVSNDLRLLNYYQSIPVNFGATVESIDGDTVELAVHQQQAVVMHLEKQTFLKSSHFPKDVLAAVSYVNIDKCVAMVTKFAYAVVRAERRQFVRVEVKDPIEATFSASGVKVTGTLNDISIGGIAIAVSVPNPPENALEGSVRVGLPGGPFEIPAKLLRVIPANEKHLAICEIRPDARAEKGISQYIFQRQVEIIRELKDSIF